MSLGVSAYKVVGAGHCYSVRRRDPWQPCERPPPGTITLKHFCGILTDPLLVLKGEEGMGKSQAQNGSKQQATCNASTLCVELHASNCPCPC